MGFGGWRRFGFAIPLGAFVLACAIALPLAANADGALRPPCAGEPIPAYPALDAAPSFAIAAGVDLLPLPESAACGDWVGGKQSLLIGLAARFTQAGGPEALLARIGAVSTLTAVRYWSYHDKRWNPLFEQAYAVDRPEGAKRRSDYPADEMRVGRDLYFAQADNRTGHTVVYRLRMTAETPTHLAFEAENVTWIKYSMLPLFAPGQIRSTFYLDRVGENEWTLYSLMRISVGAKLIGTGHEASFVNRAVALYRHIAGIPTDRDPPAVR